MRAERASMVVVGGIDALAPAHGPAFVVVGVFDGLHLGHAYLLEHLVFEASKRSARPTVITFDHHPDEILVGAAPPPLCDPQERLERLAAAGVETTVVATFDPALRMTPYDAFVHRIADRVAIAGFLMTPDATFGHDRGGTAETLSVLGAEMGFDVAVVPSFEFHGEVVRSATIRAAIAAGDLATAARLLGRPYAVTGRLADGVMRFEMPVALPPPGAYAAAVDGIRTSAVIERDGQLRLEPRPSGPRDRARVTFGESA